jgi:hypothetical protein
MAAEVLGRMRYLEGASGLVPLIEQGGAVRARALTALGRTGAPSTFELLKGALLAGTGAGILFCLHLLGEGDYEEMVDLAWRAAPVQVTRAIGLRGDSSRKHLVTRLLGDGEPGTRGPAVLAAARLGLAEAVERADRQDWSFTDKVQALLALILLRPDSFASLAPELRLVLTDSYKWDLELQTDILAVLSQTPGAEALAAAWAPFYPVGAHPQATAPPTARPVARGDRSRQRA